jgi:CHAT domain-containing protein
LELLPQQRFVHLATHGDFFHRQADAFSAQSATAALDSSLVFAGANTDATGGVESLLTAEEVGGLNLRKLDLIVLSACETGLGQVQAGQGQVGLLAALDKAGADAIVTSLWKVDDAATAALMEGLYVELLKKPEELAAAAALRAAQMQFLAAAEKKVAVEGRGTNSVAANTVGEAATRGVTRKTGPQLSVQQSHPFYWAAWGVCGGR